MQVRSTSPLFTNHNNVYQPKLIAHRGFTVEAPENSLPAFKSAGMKRYWAIETDVHVTLDEVLVCNHDRTIDAMYDGIGHISEMTLEQLMSFTLNKGNQIESFYADQLKMPTFEQYLRICRYYGSVPFIELKAECVLGVIEMLGEYGMEDCSVISTSSLPLLKEVREYTDRIFIHHIFSDMESALEIEKLGHAGVALNYKDVSMVPESDVKLLHKMGLKVCFRAGDSEEDVKSMINIGADYVPTNTIYRLTV